MDKLPPPIDSGLPSTNSKTMLERLNEAKKGAARMLGCFRVGDAHDPETYISAVVAVLETYPVDVIQAVTGPHGLPSKVKWLPTIAEIKEECQAHMPSQSVRWAREWEREAQRQIADRQQLQIAHEKPRKTYEQLQAELAEVGIFIGIDKNRHTAMKAEDIQQKYGISKDQWDAIPNAKGQ